MKQALPEVYLGRINILYRHTCTEVAVQKLFLMSTTLHATFIHCGTQYDNVWNSITHTLGPCTTRIY